MTEFTPISATVGGILSGAALFGVGWGLVGLCPGPALSSLSFGGMLAAVFTFTMVASMWLTKRLMQH